MISASSSAGDSGVEWSSDCSRSKEIESFAKGGTTGISPIAVDGVVDIHDVGEEKCDYLNIEKYQYVLLKLKKKVMATSAVLNIHV